MESEYAGSSEEEDCGKWNRQRWKGIGIADILKVTGRFGSWIWWLMTCLSFNRFETASRLKRQNMSFGRFGLTTADGWNPAPVDRQLIPLFTKFLTSQRAGFLPSTVSFHCVRRTLRNCRVRLLQELPNSRPCVLQQNLGDTWGFNPLAWSRHIRTFSYTWYKNPRIQTPTTGRVFFWKELWMHSRWTMGILTKAWEAKDAFDQWYSLQSLGPFWLPWSIWNLWPTGILWEWEWRLHGMQCINLRWRGPSSLKKVSTTKTRMVSCSSSKMGP